MQVHSRRIIYFRSCQKQNSHGNGTWLDGTVNITIGSEY